MILKAALTAFGAIQNNQGSSPLLTSLSPCDGTTPGVGGILIKYTCYGDANLDGVVNGSDDTLIDNARRGAMHRPAKLTNASR
jgi:hypothetical protein